MHLLKHRFGALYILFATLLVFSFVIRTILLVKALPGMDLTLLLLVKIYGVGLFYDCVTFSYFAIPFVLYLTLAPERLFTSRWHKPVVYLVAFVVTYALLFDVAAEFLFFDEFGTRFNFIAIDYLIYTREVIGNIKESYPLYWILGGLLLLATGIFLMLRRYLDLALTGSSTFRQRLKPAGIFAVLPLLSLGLVDLSYATISSNSYANELASNGIYDLVAAFRNNELDYRRFYVAQDDQLVLARLKELMHEKNNHFVSDDRQDIRRTITNPGPERRLNLIVIVEESLSAQYLGIFGNKEGLTPNLDKLAGESMLFTHLYATGTRTVRGLEAITLGIPPLPGTSIVKRPNNGDFFSWGSVMRDKGYDTRYIYAGYGYFDNMNAFFAGNGYSIVDRQNFGKDEITFANAWGVCDEDLFRKVIKEGGVSHRAGRPFFNMVMTTSNHRPFTYPEGKIDIPSLTGRTGGVKYADYAIGKFIEEARKQPWFNDTIIVIVADHCAGSAGNTELPVKNYEIPLFVYAPAHLKPQRIDTMLSQIDIAPTILGLLNFSYQSRFIGKDIMKIDVSQQRAFISTYQKLGFIKDDQLVVIGPQKYLQEYTFSRQDGKVHATKPQERYVDDMLAYFQGTNYIYKNRLNRIK